MRAVSLLKIQSRLDVDSTNGSTVLFFVSRRSYLVHVLNLVACLLRCCAKCCDSHAQNNAAFHLLLYLKKNYT